MLIARLFVVRTMIEFFAIFGKGGLVLWYFNEGREIFKDAVNALITDVLLQQRNVSSFKQDGVTLKYKLDNEFDLIFLVVYQSVVQMSYADKLLTEVNLRFRDMYKNVLGTEAVFLKGPKMFKSFEKDFNKIVDVLKTESNNAEPKKPRTYQESDKSKKTIASLIEKPVEPKKPEPEPPAAKKPIEEEPISPMARRILGKKGAKVAPAKKEKEAPVKKGKQKRVWDLGGTKADAAVLDYSSKPADANNGDENGKDRESENLYAQNKDLVGKFRGELPGLDENDQHLGSEEEESDDEQAEATNEKSGSGWFSAFSNLVGNKQLTDADVEPALEQMKLNLIQKNVASEPATRICESVGAKLVGRNVGTFSRVRTVVSEAMRESLMQLLTPKRRVDILRDVLHAKSEKRPYVIVFCGVNGVGKSTNLAKITFWLNENGHRVLIAAGDTFRAGAVEQLRTHMRCLNSLHQDHVQLFEQGYGGDAAKLARAAIEAAKERGTDIVLVDTAGRMQDNGPLMASLSKIIHTNNPDLVLFVGEALVGNEAVDQLVKFNQALADHSSVQENPRLIDGIVLTKFDTIDDKVGAAVSMTYITGQPIVFVGTGQTYKDLKVLNANAVVNILLK
ncbi:Signal recognition particle receptor subunit alpha-like protein [Aphelenchoides bicaudatus]|nr:Signal recognition particle receptor subunit alpha-like protein [Aphelenchoides bicaudatus]